MNRRTIGTLCGLGLVVACTGGGSPNDFGLGPTDNAPTDPGTPSDPNAPPADPNNPPFADGTVPGTSPDCRSVCSELMNLCPDEAEDYDECVRDCTNEVPAQCRNLAIDYVRCIARNGCSFEDDPQTDPNEEFFCEAELLAYVACLGPDPDPPDGEGGAGNQ